MFQYIYNVLVPVLIKLKIYLINKSLLKKWQILAQEDIVKNHNYVSINLAPHPVSSLQ